MNTSGFTFQNSIEANYLIITFPDNASFDDIALKSIKNNAPDYLIPFSMSSSNGVQSIKYKLINAIAIEYAADYSFRKSEFLQLFKNLIEPFLDCRDWLLDYHFLCVNPRFVYVEKDTFRVHYVYVPERSYATGDAEILNFLRDVFAKTSISDDSPFQVKMYKYFGGSDVTLAGLNELIAREMAPIVDNGGTRISAIINPIKSAGAITPALDMCKAVQEQTKPKVETSPLQNQAGVGSANDEDVLSLLNGQKKEKKKEKTEETQKITKEKVWMKGLFFRKEKKKEASSPVAIETQNENECIQSQQPIAINPQQIDTLSEQKNMESDFTETFDEGIGGKVGYLELLSSPISGAIPRISLSFPGEHINIGRKSSDPVQPDVAFDSSFKRIGRRHARIERKPDGYYIVDLGSQNRTLVNDAPIFPNHPVKLQNGYLVTFTDSMPVKYRVVL